MIQACRGTAFDTGTSMQADDAGDVLVHKIPVEADILVANSTVPGYYAWRNASVGSWFIQELCNVLDTDSRQPVPTDVLCLLTVVARKVALIYESKTGQPGSDGMKQMPSLVSTLMRRVYLTGSSPAPSDRSN
ncbi:unnamed protein product [Protopolystoma xenopodis]|uniref:Caspase family p10 domain-containing protein n=1 Tax=Protopolystoma xenopodis TaxID=117903 RepID=A0A3S5FFR9_9PLAT|nr:unnamed protein product [Protopolystoma xenopodis]